MKVLFILFFAILFFSGCNIEEQKARVVDSEVEGLGFQCAGDFAYTDKNGTISCAHMPIAFMVGQIKLGLLYKIPKDALILPQDIADVSRSNADDKNVIKILTILQALDEDKNPENGINIPLEVHKKLDTFIDIKKMDLAQIEEIIQAQLGEDIKFPAPRSALMHLERTMRRFSLPPVRSRLLEEYE